jgi:Senescence regulator
MEELLESEVMWPENLYEYAIDSGTNSDDDTYQNNGASYRQANGSTLSSPIAIPSTSTASSSENNGWHNVESIKLLPPHVLVARRSDSSRMAFSQGSGRGRTLKGRDLQRLRNVVWRMTGFLDR